MNVCVRVCVCACAALYLGLAVPLTRPRLTRHRLRANHSRLLILHTLLARPPTPARPALRPCCATSVQERANERTCERTCDARWQVRNGLGAAWERVSEQASGQASKQASVRRLERLKASSRRRRRKRAVLCCTHTSRYLRSLAGWRAAGPPSPPPLTACLSRLTRAAPRREEARAHTPTAAPAGTSSRLHLGAHVPVLCRGPSMPGRRRGRRGGRGRGALARHVAEQIVDVAGRA